MIQLLHRVKELRWTFCMQLSQLLTFDLPRQNICLYCDMCFSLAARHLLVITIRFWPQLQVQFNLIKHNILFCNKIVAMSYFFVPSCEMETGISSFAPHPLIKKDSSSFLPRQYIFITYLSSRWLHHLTFKSPLLRQRHSAELTNQYGSAGPRPPAPALPGASTGIRDNGHRVNEGWGGENRSPGEAARGIFTATNNDKSGNIAPHQPPPPKCRANSNDWPRVSGIGAEPYDLQVAMETPAFLIVWEFLIDVSWQSRRSQLIWLIDDVITSRLEPLGAAKKTAAGLRRFRRFFC